MRVFIAEKPSLGRAIAHILDASSSKTFDGCIRCGEETFVTWCFGHILEQFQPDDYDEKWKIWRMDDLPILPENWQLKISKSCEKQFSIIERLCKQADEIIHAGDPDREGQLLVDEVLDFIHNKKPVKRILLNALDDASIKQALQNLQDNKNFVGLKNSALARSRADWLVGMNLSRAYTLRMKQSGYDGVVSVGRVQTPTMALVVRREEEIKNFQPKKFFVLKVFWDKKFWTTWKPKDTTDGLDEEGRLLKRSVCENLLKKLQGASGKITSVEKKLKKEKQRAPYSLSTLQIEAGKKFSLSPQQILDAMQSLYEKKLTTYPRSDCEFLPTNQHKDAKIILKNLKILPELKNFCEQADETIQSPAWNDKKISAHHAIIPTRIVPNFSSLTDIEKKLYSLVARAYVAQFFPVHEYQQTKITVESCDEIFTATGRTVTVLGWKALYKAEPKDEKDSEIENESESNELPSVKKNQTVHFVEGKIFDRETKPPAHFTEASLVQAMKEIYKFVRDPEKKLLLKECQGIGTEATRASIIENLQKRGFLQLVNKKLMPTEKAATTISILSEEITYPDSTAMWEMELEKIKTGANKNIKDFLNKQMLMIKKLLEASLRVKIKNAPKTFACPRCGRILKQRQGKNGVFWGCAGYPKCNFTANDENGKPSLPIKK